MTVRRVLAVQYLADTEAEIAAITANPGDVAKALDTETFWERQASGSWVQFVAGTLSAASIQFSASDLLLGRSTASAGAGEEIACTAAGRAVLDDASAADQRTTLELGDSATKNVGTAAGDIAAGDHTHTGYQATSEKDGASGYAGLDASSRVTKGVIAADDVIVTDAAKGLVLKDTQGTPHFWRISVSTLGVLASADLGTEAP